MARVIKKYPNRRLYDTEESRYITLTDIRDLVLRSEIFVVIDKKSGTDISRSVLLQVISEQEQHGDPILSVALLAEIVRAHDSEDPSILATQLERSLAEVVSSQSPAVGAVSKPVGTERDSMLGESRPLAARPNLS